ncbi:lipoprotein [Streptomyces hygroscopicus]|uniref:hypothetical protein n=1 Tax=Streptomyces hygroscopicus TaxID=1912 RepID=UPI0022407C6F|nr:hypothetical protein [Streptomyces hygroscopicus]MCW7945225.1 lipoprotein [Streptomyces hygroscopicus]
MRLRHTAAWVGITAAALMATSACDAESAKTAAKAVDNADRIMAALARATDRTENLGSAEVRMTTEMPTTGPITMNGTYSWGHGFAFDVETDTKAVRMQRVHAAAKTRMLFVDGAYYYQIDPQPSGPLKGKEWMKIDASAVFGDKGAQAFQGNSGSGSPAAAMRGLKYANNVDDLGRETVDGQSATHYRAVVDQAHMGKFKEAYGDQNSVFGALTGGADSITMDVWVGAKDLPVRLNERIGSATVSMDFEKFGATAEIKAPPAAQTGDVTEQLKKARAQQQG